MGRACIVNTAATIDHDCWLGDGVHVCPGTHLAGNVSIGDRAWIGIGSAVRQRLEIGADAVVGAGAAVVADVPSGKTVVGVPARIVGTSR
jgi:acetyltransferase-like isoleucine patch superfamily enzyme